MQEILQRLDKIERLLSDYSDRMLSFKEACEYTDLSASQMYKLTHLGEITHYKPNGKKIYFSKSDLDAWLKRNRIRTNEEIDQAAVNHISRNGGGR